ncbi:MmyB family transcriptional regulator [Streptomyces sp. URMC 129]|uniref:MmyB family transcriptional regulator n=1 Tax=Streptomyces sp. URMC 129 TaxID=3423407 RepID=UPI003F1C1D5B
MDIEPLDDEHTEEQALNNLRLLIDALTLPAALLDRAWDFVTVNDPFAELWPYAREPGANLIRWVLLSPEARQVSGNEWERDARRFVRALRHAVVAHVDDERILPLLAEVEADPAAGLLWRKENRYRGHGTEVPSAAPVPGQYRFGERTLTLLFHPLLPLEMPRYHVTIVTPLGEEQSAGA